MLFVLDYSHVSSLFVQAKDVCDAREHLVIGNECSLVVVRVDTFSVLALPKCSFMQIQIIRSIHSRR